ncbi:MAG: hypothetical protein WBV76_23145, partial [Pseudolabrys sp.]
MTVEQVGKSGASVTHNVCFSNRPVWVKRLQTIHHSSFDVTSAAGRRPLQNARDSALLYSITSSARASSEGGTVKLSALA